MDIEHKCKIGFTCYMDKTLRSIADVGKFGKKAIYISFSCYCVSLSIVFTSDQTVASSSSANRRRVIERLLFRSSLVANSMTSNDGMASSY